MAQPSPVLLQGEFSVTPCKQREFSISPRKSSATKCTVSLTVSTITYSPEDKAKGGAQEIQIGDVVGCDVEGKAETDKDVSFSVYHYPYQPQFLTRKEVRQREKVSFAVSGLTDPGEVLRTAERWCRFIQRLLQGETTDDLSDVLKEEEKRLLVLINPFGGSGRAKHMFEDKAAPLLTEAGFKLDVIVTERAGQGYDIARKVSLGKYCGIVVVSGDGLFNEVGNGLIHHTDQEEALKLPIGVLPGGSSNAHCVSFLHSAGESFRQDPFTHAAFLIARHRPHPMDVFAVDTCRGRRMYGWLSLSWGFMADVDIESERFRLLGTARFQIGVATRLLNLRRYKGKLHYKPADDNHAQTTNEDSSVNGSIENSSNIANGLETGDSAIPGLERQLSGAEGTSDETASPTNQSQKQILDTEVDINLSDEPKVFKPKELPTRYLPAISDPVPDDWLTIEDEFIYVVVVNHKFVDPDVMTVPYAEVDDGLLYLQYMRATPDISRGRVVEVMMAMPEGKHIYQGLIKTIKVKAFRIEPLTEGAVMTVDGETIPYGPMQGEVLPSKTNVMAGCTHKKRTPAYCEAEL